MIGDYYCWYCDPYWFTCGRTLRWVLRWPKLDIGAAAWRFEWYLGRVWVRFGKMPPVVA